MTKYSHENGGTWYKGTRQKPVHYCNKPDFQLRDVDVEKGDRWQCGECGQVWEVISKSDAFAYDSPKGGWSIAFKKVPGVGDTREDDLNRLAGSWNDPNRTKCW